MTNSIVESANINIKTVYEINVRNYSRTSKNDMSQIRFQDTLLKPTVSFNDIENMIVTYDGSLFQNLEK